MATLYLAPLKSILLILLITSLESWYGLKYPRSITEPFTDVENINLTAHRQLFLPCSSFLTMAKRMSNKSKLRRRQFTWHKHGYISLAVPDSEPVINITIYMDISLNPGPETGNDTVCNLSLNGRMTPSCIQSHRAVGCRLSFSPDTSTSLRRNLECRTHMACSQFLTDLENSGLLHCYRKSGRQQENILSDHKKNNIETLVTHRPPCKSAYAQNRTVNENNIINITLLPDTPAADINNNRIGELFTLCVLNAQSLNNKAAQFIDYVVDCKADIVSLTETWFTNTESATRVLCPPNGYNLLDHPRSNRVGGGTGILFKENITVKKLAAGELRSFEYSEWSVVNGSRRLHLELLPINRSID